MTCPLAPRRVIVRVFGTMIVIVIVIAFVIAFCDCDCDCDCDCFCDCFWRDYYEGGDVLHAHRCHLSPPHASGHTQHAHHKAGLKSRDLL